MEVIEIKEEDFKEKIKEGKVVVDCFATWCGPCKMLSPILDQVARESEGISFYKIDIDEAESVAEEYEISSIPTILVFENGELKNTSVGLKSKDEILEMIR